MTFKKVLLAFFLIGLISIAGCLDDPILIRLSGGSGSDTNKVAVSATDTNAGFLFSKLTQGANISLTVLNPGANETVRISAVSGSGGKTYTSGTPGTLQVDNDNNTISQNFDGNFTSRINGLDLNNSLSYSKVNCDNNSSCTFTGKITTTKDINANNIRFNGILSGGDFNYSLSDANGTQSCSAGQVLQTVGSSVVCVSLSSGSGRTYTSGTPGTIQVDNDLNTISQNFDGNFWSRFTPASDGNIYTKITQTFDSNFWSRFTPANDGNFYVRFQTNFDSNFWVRFTPAFDGNFWLRFTPANDGNFYTRFKPNFDSNFNASFDSNFWSRFTPANDGNFYTRFQNSFDTNFVSHIIALDLNNSLSYSKVNCDNNSNCTFTGKITTTRDANLNNIKFNGTLSGGDFNYSLSDANGTQTCGAGQALQTVGSSTSCVSVGSIDSNKVAVSATDTTPDYLNNKIVSGLFTSKTLLNGGGNEQIRINSSTCDKNTSCIIPSSDLNWDSNSTLDSRYVLKTGDSMSGSLNINTNSTPAFGVFDVNDVGGIEVDFSSSPYTVFLSQIAPFTTNLFTNGTNAQRWLRGYFTDMNIFGILKVKQINVDDLNASATDLNDWTSVQTDLNNRFVKKAGDTMTGSLILSANSGPNLTLKGGSGSTGGVFTVQDVGGMIIFEADSGNQLVYTGPMRVAPVTSNPDIGVRATRFGEYFGTSLDISGDSNILDGNFGNDANVHNRLIVDSNATAYNFICQTNSQGTCLTIPTNTFAFNVSGQPTTGEDFNGTGRYVGLVNAGRDTFRFGLTGNADGLFQFNKSTTSTSPSFASMPNQSGIVYMFDTGSSTDRNVLRFNDSNKYVDIGSRQTADLNVDKNVFVGGSLYGQVFGAQASVGTSCTAECDAFDNIPGGSNWSCIAAVSLAGVASTCSQTLIAVDCMCKN